MLNLDYDKMFKISILALKLNRSYPTIPKDKFWFCSIIPIHAYFSLSFYLILYSMFVHDLKNNDFAAACTNGILSVLYIAVTFKYVVLLVKAEDITFAMNKVKGDFAAAKHLCSDEQAITTEYAYKACWVTKVWLLTASSVFCVFPIQVIVLSIYNYAIGDFQFVHMYQMTFPEAIETRKYETNMYLFLLILQTYFGVYVLLMFAGFTPLGLIFMLHVCGRIEIVKYRISKLFEGEHYDPREIQQRLKNIVMPLQDVLDFVDLLKKTFRLVYEVYMKSTTIVIPIASYEVLQSLKEGRPSIEFMTFIVAGAVLCFAPCYYSDLLMEKGLSLRMSVYTSGWEAYPDSAMRRTLCIIMCRLERDVAIRTLFQTVNLDAFSELCHQSYALFNVINTAWS
uniref:Odorant receptor n=1 Tax=Cydia pomonella TaxID=82600 RepID=H9A5Q1_CYDPO|nr:putative odorant receptor OR40 [Cydia pomonella]